MLRQISAVAAWLGGWFRLLLLVVVLVGLGAGLIWERQRHIPSPPQAQQARTTLAVNVRQTSFQYSGSAEEVRTFYRQVLSSRGWRYCGTQDTPRCTNLISLNDGSGQQTDVYRRLDDHQYRGSTVEISPIQAQNGQTFVSVFETPSR